MARGRPKEKVIVTKKYLEYLRGCEILVESIFPGDEVRFVLDDIKTAGRLAKEKEKLDIDDEPYVPKSASDEE